MVTHPLEIMVADDHFDQNPCECILVIVMTEEAVCQEYVEIRNSLENDLNKCCFSDWSLAEGITKTEFYDVFLK